MPGIAVHDGAVAGGVELGVQVLAGGQDTPIEAKTRGSRQTGKEKPEAATVAFPKGMDRVQFAIEMCGTFDEDLRFEALELILCGKPAKDQRNLLGTNAESQ